MIDDLGRRYWAGLQNGSRMLPVLLIAGFLLLGIGLIAHRGFLEGMGAGLLIVAAVVFPAYLRRERS
jgi:hypothetical protein